MFSYLKAPGDGKGGGTLAYAATLTRTERNHLRACAVKEDLARSIPFRQTIIREVGFGGEQHEEPLTEVSRGRDKQLTGTSKCQECRVCHKSGAGLCAVLHQGLVRLRAVL